MKRLNGYSYIYLIATQVIKARGQRECLHGGSHKYRQRRPSQEGSTRLTVMLLTISFTFLVTTLPLTLVSIAAAFVSRTTGRDALTTTRFELARTIAELLMYANHAINFYLYCATGQKFRHQLIWTVCYSRRTYWLPGDADRRSPGPSAAGPGMGRLPTDTPSRLASGGRLAMRAGDAVLLRRLGNSAGGGSGGSVSSGGAGQQQGASVAVKHHRSQLNVMVDIPGNAAIDNADHQLTRRDITTAPCTHDSVV